MPKYQMLYIISGDVTDNDVESKVKTVDKVVTDLGGKITDSETVGRKKLAYTIKKQEFGTYVKLYFEIEGDKLVEIPKEFKSHSFVLRHIIISAPDIKVKLARVKKAKIETADKTATKIAIAKPATKKTTAKKTEAVKKPAKTKSEIAKDIETEDARLKELDEKLDAILKD
jgi:small subunit ribosomal protein S6